MAKQKVSVVSGDTIAGICGFVLTWAGVDGVSDAIASSFYDNITWKVGIGLIIFGSMIMGVAINRVSNSLKNSKESALSKKLRRKK